MHNERQKLDKRKELIRNLATLRKEKEKATRTAVLSIQTIRKKKIKTYRYNIICTLH